MRVGSPPDVGGPIECGTVPVTEFRQKNCTGLALPTKPRWLDGFVDVGIEPGLHHVRPGRLYPVPSLGLLALNRVITRHRTR